MVETGSSLFLIPNRRQVFRCNEKKSPPGKFIFLGKVNLPDDIVLPYEFYRNVIPPLAWNKPPLSSGNQQAYPSGQDTGKRPLPPPLECQTALKPFRKRCDMTVSLPEGPPPLMRRIKYPLRHLRKFRGVSRVTSLFYPREE